MVYKNAAEMARRLLEHQQGVSIDAPTPPAGYRVGILRVSWKVTATEARSGVGGLSGSLERCADTSRVYLRLWPLAWHSYEARYI